MNAGCHAFHFGIGWKYFIYSDVYMFVIYINPVNY